MIVYITKYALIRGIFIAETNSDPQNGTATIRTTSDVGYACSFFEPHEYTLTLEDALQQTKDMLRKKADNHKKQLLRLQNKEKISIHNTLTNQTDTVMLPRP